MVVRPYFAGPLLAVLVMVSACDTPPISPVPAAPSPTLIALPTAEPPSLTPVQGLQGRLWFDRALGDVWQIDLATAQASQVGIPTDVFALQPSVPLSGTPVSFVGVSKSNGVVTGAYHIYIAGKRVIVEDGNASYQDPAWSADGMRLFFTRIGRYPGQTTSHSSGLNIQMVEPGKDMSPQTVVTDATQPAPSYDGRWLAYVGIDITRPPTLSKSIHVVNLLSGEDHLIVPAGHFNDIYGPRWMPNSSQLIFSALDPAGDAQPPPTSATGALLEAIGNLLGVHVAAAHTWAGDVWGVTADGSGLTRLTHQLFSAPIVAPAPDGNHIAVAALNGIWVMNADGSGLTRVSNTDTSGNICWSE